MRKTTSKSSYVCDICEKTVKQEPFRLPDYDLTTLCKQCYQVATKGFQWVDSKHLRKDTADNMKYQYIQYMITEKGNVLIRR